MVFLKKYTVVVRHDDEINEFRAGQELCVPKCLIPDSSTQQLNNAICDLENVK